MLVIEEKPLAFAAPRRSKPEFAAGDRMETLRARVFAGQPSGQGKSELMGLVELLLRTDTVSSDFFAPEI